MKFTIYLFLFVFLISCTTEEPQEVPIMAFEEFEPYIQKDNDTVYVINFWSTSTETSQQELAEFEKFNKAYKNKAVRVILVSLDSLNKHESDLIPFIKENHLKSQVIHLTNTDTKRWINKVSGLWLGVIPATLIYKKTSREFYEKPLTYEDLVSIVDAKQNN